MKQTMKQHAGWMTAITFAEAGEWETAQTFVPPYKRWAMTRWLEKNFMAITFAEAGLVDEAMRFQGGGRLPMHGSCDEFLEILGLCGARLTYGVIDSMDINCHAELRA